MHRTYETITLGRRLRACECAGGVRLIESAYAPLARFAPHAHDRGNVSLLVSGQLEESVGREALCATTCGVVVKPAGTVHGNRFGPQGARTLLVELPAGDVETKSLSRWRWFHGGPVTAAALHLYRAFRAEPASDLRDLVDELIAAIEDDAGRVAPRPPPPWVERVRDALHDTFPRQVCVAALARSMGVHPVYLARVFRARYGCAVTEYVQRLRVRAAAHWIACSAEPLCGVACHSGFSDQAHLTRVFKRDTGLTPGAFRRLAQGN